MKRDVTNGNISRTVSFNSSSSFFADLVSCWLNLLRAVLEPFVQRVDRNPLLAGLGYCLLGLVVGGLSLLVFPNSFVRSERFHGINLVITPLLAGLVMAGIGRLRANRGEPLIRLDSFAYGFTFAFAMAAVRFCCTN